MSASRPVQLGRRIVVWGVTGSGKTALAGRLSEALGLPRVELDAIRHATGWDSVGWDDFRAILTRRLEEAPEGWVLDGSYSPISDVYLPSADTLIWLNLPWRVAFWRLLTRTLRSIWTKEPLYGADGPRESWRMTFLSRRSILWWSIRSHRGRMRRIPERIATLPPGIPVYELHSPREVSQFLNGIDAKQGTPRDALPSSKDGD